VSFDRLALHYDWLETLTAGRRLERMRVAGLDALRGCRRILSMGEGHGRFAAACVARYPEAELTCVDASERMLARAQRRVAKVIERMPPPHPRVTWQCADVLNWSSEQKFDAVVTCFFLDCFPAPLLEQVIDRIALSTTRDALWVNVDFAVPERGWRRWRAQAIHRIMYTFFRAAVGLPARHWTAPDKFFGWNGFRIQARTESEWGLLRTEVRRRAPILRLKL
jgi:SAM-dependent methyltransferase